MLGATLSGFSARKERLLYVTDVQNVLELLMWFQFLNIVCTDVDEKRLSVRMTYGTRNIVFRVVKSEVTAWTAPSVLWVKSR